MSKLGCFVDVPLDEAVQPKTGACITQHFWIARQIDNKWHITWYDFGRNDGGMPEMAPQANQSEEIARYIRDRRFKEHDVKYVEVVFESSVAEYLKEQRSKR